MLKKNKFKWALIGLVFATSAMANRGGLTYHEIQIRDELGRPVTAISTVTIYAPATTSAATIYRDRGRNNAITQPITTTSDNTTLSNGRLYWWGPDGWDYTIGDGTNTHHNGGHASLNASDGYLVFPSYLQSISSTTYTDAQNATWGSGGDWVQQGGATQGLLSFTCVNDNSEFRIGSSGTSANAGLNVYVGNAIGLKIDSSGPTFTWDGGIANINVSSHFATNINTGTSTGAINLGTQYSGAWAIDGTSTGTLNADTSIGITVSAGTIDIAATGGDIDIDGVDSSVIIDGGQAVDDAVTIVATGTAGGIDITSLGDIDITTTGAATEDITITNTGGSILVTATENVQGVIHVEENGGTSGSINIYSNQGTGASATTEHDASIQLHSDDGGISLYTTGDVANAISLETNSGSSETITVSNVQGTDASSIDIDSTVGGITIATNAASKDVDIDSVLGSINIEAEEDAADAIHIIADGGTTSGIIILNDTGTGDESILLDSDAGGITINANAGSIDIEAVGGDAGDIILNSGDDMTFTVAGDLTETVTGAIAISAVGVTITSSGVITTNGAFYETDLVTESHSAAHTITDPTDIGTLILVDTAAVIITLPAVSANAVYRVMNVGADGTEIHVVPNAADKFIGGCGFAAALDDADKLTNTGATADYGDMVELTYFDGTGWLMTKMVGTWADGGP